VPRRAPRADQLIVWYKFGKAAVELAAALAFILAASGVTLRGLSLLHALGPALHDHLAGKWIRIVHAALSAFVPSHMYLAAAGLTADAVVSFIEGWGVWRQRRWATWVIVAATGALIPLEILLLFEKWSTVKLVVLAANVATVAYMIRVRSTRIARRAHTPLRRRAVIAFCALAAYVGLAYVVLPWSLRAREAARALDAAPDWAVDNAGEPSDPVNVALVGSREDVVSAMQGAGWTAARALSLDTALGIGEGVLLRRFDPGAPVSTLYLDGRHQDLAFEQQVGGTPRRRHHVRFWLETEAPISERPLWLGGATYDRGIGLAHDTGEITHLIDRDVDAERDKLLADLIDRDRVTEVYWVKGVGRLAPSSHARVYSDGMAAVAVLPAEP
jgi:uncharacterized membrane protein (DUF2068 family)